MALPPPVTVRVVAFEMPPDAAVIVVEPAVAAVAIPLDPAALLMVATAVTDEVQVTDVVRFCVLLSEKVPVAVNCCTVPLAIEGLVGVREMETSVFAVELPLPPPPPPPQAVARARIRIKNSILLDLIDAHSRRDQGGSIGPTLQIPHMSPFLYNDLVRLYVKAPAAGFARGVPQGCLVFVVIRAQ